MDDLNEEVRNLYQSFGARVFRHLLFFTGNEADAKDLLQDTMIRYVRFRSRGGWSDRPLSFLFRTATRLAMKKHKTRSRRKLLEHKISHQFKQDLPDEQVGVLETLEKIWRRLDMKAKVCAKLLIVDQMNESEIARHTGMSRTTVRKKLERIRRLAEKSEDSEDGEKKSGQKPPLGSS